MSVAWSGLPYAERKRRREEDKEKVRQWAAKDPEFAGMIADLSRNAAKYRIEFKLSEQHLREQGFKRTERYEYEKGDIIVLYGQPDVVHNPGFCFASPNWICMTDVGDEFITTCESGHVRNALAELYSQIAEANLQHRESPEGRG